MGPVLGVHRQKFGYRYGIPLACVGLMAFAGLLVAAIHYMPEQFDAEYQNKAYLIMVAAPIVCAVLLAKWRKTRGTVVRLHEQGFELDHGGRTEAARFDQITEVWRSHFDGPFPAGGDAKPGYQITTEAGARIRIPKTIAGMDTLGAKLEDEVARRHLPAARAAIAAGQTIPLGAYSFTRDAISFRTTSTLQAIAGNLSADQLTKTETVPWSALTDVRLDTHWVRLKRPGGTDVYVAFNAIPNVPIVMRLIEDAKHVRIGA